MRATVSYKHMYEAELVFIEMNGTGIYQVGKTQHHDNYTPGKFVDRDTVIRKLNDYDKVVICQDYLEYPLFANFSLEEGEDA